MDWDAGRGHLMKVDIAKNMSADALGFAAGIRGVPAGQILAKYDEIDT